jgi:hypothetical protein
VGRRLGRIGAVALKNSVYVLPNTDSTREDFEWIRQEIVQDAGEAMLAEANLIAGLSDAEIEGRFRQAKDAEYTELFQEARALRVEATGRRKRPLSDEERARLEAEIGKSNASCRTFALLISLVLRAVNV